MALTKVPYSMIEGAPINLLDFGASPSATGATNSAALQAAMNAVATTGNVIYIPAGTYSFSSVVSTTGNIGIIGDGDSTVLDFSGITSSSSAINVTGSVTQIQNITAASKDGLTITFASAPSLSTGDVFCLFESARLWNSARSYYYYGEWCKCRGTSGVSAYVTNPLYDGYVAADTVVYKLSSPKVLLKDFKIIGGANIFGLINLTYCNEPTVENVTVYNSNYQGMIIDRCYDARITNVDIYNKGTGTLDDYGLVIGNCQNVQVSGGSYYGRRHGIAIGGGDYPCAVTNRNLRISNATLSNDISSQVSSADMHGNVEDVYYQGCQIYQGAALAGKNTGYDNCTINNQYQGIVVYASELKGGSFSVRNCTLITAVDSSSVSRGIIDFGGNGGAILPSTNETVSIIIENCHVEGRSQTSGTDFLRMANNGSSAYVNVYINGVTANVNAMGTVLRTGVNTGSALSQAIVVDNISNFPSGTYLHYSIGNAYSSTPQRLMRQSGVTNMTATSGTYYTISGAVYYRYVYQRTPVATASIISASIFNSTIPVNPGIYSVTASYIRPELYSSTGGNWTATTAYDVHWTVGLDEI